MKKIMFNDKCGLTQAVLEGRKTQTRRIITYPKTFKGKDVCGLYVYRWKVDGVITEICMYDRDEISIDGGQILPKYKVGEIVAVAQSYNSFYNDECNPNLFPNGAGWTNKMYVKPKLMPHQIRITNVRAELLQDISDEDCLKEGVIKGQCGSADTHFMDAYYVPNDKQPYCRPQDAYEIIIDKISGKGTWRSNPLCFVYDFELVK